MIHMPILPQWNHLLSNMCDDEEEGNSNIT